MGDQSSETDRDRKTDRLTDRLTDSSLCGNIKLDAMNRTVDEKSVSPSPESCGNFKQDRLSSGTTLRQLLVVVERLAAVIPVYRTQRKAEGTAGK